MRHARSVFSATAVAALVVGSTAFLAVPVSAAPNTTPQGVCGSAYKTVNSASVGSLGNVYLTYNSANGRNCVATIRNNPGTALAMAAWVRLSGTTTITDSGNYTSYAGPVSVYGKARCIDWGGTIKNVTVTVSKSNCGSRKEHRVTAVH
ncbi:spore-associated protein A [Streptomyces spiroverticillatus]|uniref:Spore-associated protein A n=1 Tax=Streptomyces finlayi TaxID=67296 RepID=A0A919CFS2_9ACTN|nr:spore-associated protein [Streptomyces finlayi]GHA46926.1 spore-associated protein A [Streptomyces spiroverticillatus]GHD18291.1 spore-associated protein A [Streptomyces finlayi]